MTFNFSYFDAPISNKVPGAVMTLHEIHHLIVNDPALERATLLARQALPDERRFREIKQRSLPYFTPAGVFTYCSREGLLCPCGLFVVDVDHLATEEEAAQLRDALFADRLLQTQLAFVSPGGKGVKTLHPYRLRYDRTVADSLDEAVRNAWAYLKLTYGVEADPANRDISRACFLCHDGGALSR